MRYQFMRYPEGKAKAVTLSYDDGPPEDEKFSEIISRYGLKCTFNLNSEKLHPCFTSEQMEECYLARGHEIAVHGAFHRAEGMVRPIEGIKDVLDCRLELENKTGIIIRGMAYPDSGISSYANNASYDNIKKYLTDLGIVYARTLGGDNNKFALPTDWHAWMPTAHHKNPKLMDMIHEFLSIDLSDRVYASRRAPRLFYLWGHSYEFEKDNNWKLLENVCCCIGEKKDIWYATNIEIYEYVNAYHSLVYSADGKMIYNPTLFTIWFTIDGGMYQIVPGETLKLQ